MKKFTFVTDPAQAAIDFATENKDVRPIDVDFSIVPCSLCSSVEFWVRLVNENPAYIGRVPRVILDNIDFANSIDHNLFYLALPKAFLTEEDYKFRKEHRDYACTEIYGARVEISRNDESIWYKFRSRWMAASKLTPREIMNQLDELTRASDLDDDLWSQELADLLWNSSKAFVSFNAIPETYVRPEWRVLVDVYANKRYPLFGRGSTTAHPENLAAYWSKFKTKEQLDTAFQLEEMVQRCSNPYGYAMQISFDEEQSMDHSKGYKDMYEAVKPVAEHEPEILTRFVKLYGPYFSAQVPEGLFDINWILESDVFKSCISEYHEALEELDYAESEVEKLEAQEYVDDAISDIKALLGNFKRMTEDEMTEFIKLHVK